MKLYFDKRIKDPTYYAQQGFRNGRKTTTTNVKSFDVGATYNTFTPRKSDILSVHGGYRIFAILQVWKMG